MRVCLITPPSDFLLDQRVFMSLGILKVGAALEAASVTVDHLDLTGVENYMDAVEAYPYCGTFAITATTPQLPAAVRIARRLREHNAHVVLGGPHATLVNAAAKKGSERARVAFDHLLKEFTCIVAGDGERAILDAIKRIGVIDADDPKSPYWHTSQQFAESPFPARHLVDVGSYHYSVDGERALSLVGQLGCPFHCAFCGGRNSPMLRQIRKRPAESVVKEMMHLYDMYGVKGLMFLDDELNVNRSIVELMKQIAATGIEWRLRGFVKAELFTEEQAEWMYKAGFRWLLCGFESAAPRILRNIAKVATVEDNTRMLHIAHRHGLKVKALMSIGHPGESVETVKDIEKWLLAERPDDFDCTVITIYPGTPYYDDAKQNDDGVYVYETHGDRLYSNDPDFMAELQYYKGRPGEYQSFVWTDYLEAGQLVRLRDQLEDNVREELGLPYATGAAALNYEHTMGMKLPGYILKGTHDQLHNVST